MRQEKVEVPRRIMSDYSLEPGPIAGCRGTLPASVAHGKVTLLIFIYFPFCWSTIAGSAAISIISEVFFCHRGRLSQESCPFEVQSISVEVDAPMSANRIAGFAAADWANVSWLI